MDTMNCQTCGAAMDSGNLDRRLAIITCDHCGAIFDLTRRPGGTTPKADQGTTPSRAPVAIPPRFRLKKTDSSLKISYRWFRAQDVFLLVFAIMWDGFLLLWYSSVPASGDSGFDLIFALVPLIHVAVGVGITYRAIAGFVNTTTLRAKQGELQIVHRPLPWWPAPTISTSDLEQLYVAKQVHHTKRSTTVTFELRAVTRTHHSQLLIRGFTELAQPLWLEQEIESYLGIRDRAVAGEVKPDDVRH